MRSQEEEETIYRNISSTLIALIFMLTLILGKILIDDLQSVGVSFRQNESRMLLDGDGRTGVGAGC